MPEKKDFFVIRQDMLEKKYFFVITERRHAISNNKQTPLSPNNEINKPTAGGISDGKEKTMRYKNYILSKGDKVKLKPYSDDWLPSMTKNYGGKVVTIKDFIYNFGFVCEPLGDDVASYMFDVNDIDEVVYRKNNEDKIKKYEIKKGLECCAAVGSEASCSDCSYCYRCRDLCKDALDLITEQEKEIEQLMRERDRQAGGV